MKLAVAWVDPGVDEASVTPWPADTAEMATLVVGSQAGPELSSWLVRNQIRALLLIARPAHRRALGYVANVVTGAHRDILVATRTTPFGAVAALTHGVLLAGADTTPSGKVALFDSAMASPWSGAWLQSVTSVEHPAPRVSSYLRSLFPGGPRFLLISGPLPGIFPAGVPLLNAPTGGDLLVACGEEDVPQALRACFPALQVVKFPIPAPIKPIYGSRGCEFAILDRTLPTLPPAEGLCTVCEQPLYHAICPFCHVLSSRSELQ